MSVPYSMTGFGRGEGETPAGRIRVEVHAVNHRYSDINLRLPRSLSLLEERIRGLVAEYVTRGRVEMQIVLDPTAEHAVAVQVNTSLARQYADSLRSLAQELGLPPAVDLPLLVQLPDVLAAAEPSFDPDMVGPSVEQVVRQALQQMQEMRAREGDKLAVDLRQRAAQVRTWVDQVEAQAPRVVEHYRDRLQQRVRELLGESGSLVDPQRLAAEVAIFADRSNITEEVVRLKSHLDQFSQALSQPAAEGKGAVGRKLDFLLQEMNREINTVGAKANDLAISQHVVWIKAELEKMREQVQNLE